MHVRSRRISGAVVAEARLGIEFVGGVPQRIRQRTRRHYLPPERITGIGLRPGASRIGQGCNRAETVRLAGIDCPRLQLSQRLVNVFALRETGDIGSVSICDFDHVVAIVCTHGRARRPRLVDSSAEEIVFEADRSRASDSHLRQAVLKLTGSALRWV